MNLVSNELTTRGWPVALIPINSGAPNQVIPTCEACPLQREWRGSVLNTFLAISKFNVVVRSWRPDVIILNCDLPELFGVLLFSNLSLVAVEHINRPWITRVGFGKIVRKLLKIHGVTCVAISSHLTIWTSRQLPAAILLSPINVKNSPRTWNSDHAKYQRLNRLIFIGRLAKQKRPDWLLEIATQTQLPLILLEMAQC